MDINHKDLVIFTTICEYSSFTKASEVLFISQPTLSKTIKKLEKELNTHLLERAIRPLIITETGKLFYKRSKEIIKLFESTKLEISDYSEGLSGEINIGMPQIIGSIFLPVIAKELREKFPDVSLNIIEEGGHTIEKLIGEGQLSMGLCVLPTLHKNLESRLIYEDEFIICVPNNHKLSNYKEIPLKKLEDENFILFDKSFAINRIINTACKEEGFTPQVLFESSQWDLVMELVSSNIGITIVPRILYNKLNNINVVPIRIKDTKIIWRIGVVFKEKIYLSSPSRKLIDLIENIYTE